MKKIKFLTIAFFIIINIAFYYRQDKLSANCKPISNKNDTLIIKYQDTLIFNSVQEVFIKYNLKS